MFNIRIIADCSSSVSGEFLVDSLERGVSLSLGFLDTVLMVFVVLGVCAVVFVVLAVAGVPPTIRF